MSPDQEKGVADPERKSKGGWSTICRLTPVHSMSCTTDPVGVTPRSTGYDQAGSGIQGSFCFMAISAVEEGQAQVPGTWTGYSDHPFSATPPPHSRPKDLVR